MRPLLALTKAHFLRFFRDKVYLIMILLLPVLFLIIFGGIHSNDDINLRVSIYNESSSQIAKDLVAQIDEIDSFEVIDQSREYAEESMTRGSLHGIIVFPDDFGSVDPESGVPVGNIEVIHRSGDEIAGQTIGAIFSSILDAVNKELGQPDPHFVAEVRELQETGLTMFDHVVAGLVAFAIMSIGFTAIAYMIPIDREAGVLRRMATTPIKKWQFLGSYLLAFVAIGVIGITLMMLVAIYLFDFNMNGSWLNFAAMSLFGLIVMVLMGLIVASIAKTENQGSIASQLVMFPMMFLSGVFFPSFMMAEWIQAIGRALPLTYINDSLRLIMTENYGLYQLLPQIAVLAGFSIVFAAIVIKMFKWDNERV